MMYGKDNPILQKKGSTYEKTSCGDDGGFYSHCIDIL